MQDDIVITGYTFFSSLGLHGPVFFSKLAKAIVVLDPVSWLKKEDAEKGWAYYYDRVALASGNAPMVPIAWRERGGAHLGVTGKRDKEAAHAGCSRDFLDA